MLQQTTVATVAPRYLAFLNRFPTLESLAAAEEADVLRMWEGLGYYRRARNLHATARVLQALGPDANLDDPDLWCELPGVGRYILGAVLSQAFNRRLPIVDANVRRVLCRLFALRGDPTREPLRDRLWTLAEEIMPRLRCGDFNQALMELGALVCTPQSPRCSACPLADQCRARAARQVHLLPELPRRESMRTVREVALIVRRRGRVLLVQRPDAGRWSRMWEFPRGEQQGDDLAKEAGRLLTKMTGLTGEYSQVLATLRHTVMRTRIDLVGVFMDRPRGRFHSGSYIDYRWVTPGEVAQFPLSSPQRRLASLMLAG